MENAQPEVSASILATLQARPWWLTRVVCFSTFASWWSLTMVSTARMGRASRRTVKAVEVIGSCHMGLPDGSDRRALPGVTSHSLTGWWH